MSETFRVTPELFADFCSHLKISSKEEGLIPFKLWPIQQYYVESVLKAYNAGIHEFVVLKTRQGGITTVSVALCLAWMIANPGMVGVMIGNDGEILAEVRENLQILYGSLPEDNEIKIPVLTNNRQMFSLRNGSRLALMAAIVYVNSYETPPFPGNATKAVEVTPTAAGTTTVSGFSVYNVICSVTVNTACVGTGVTFAINNSSGTFVCNLPNQVGQYPITLAMPGQTFEFVLSGTSITTFPDLTFYLGQ